jgi:hypothetical protein
MEKTKAEGYRINGVFCEVNQPVLCDLIGLRNFAYKLENSQDKVPVPSIKDTGTLYRIKFCDEDTVEYLDEDSGLIFQFYNDDRLCGNPLVLVLKEVDLKNFFYEYFQFYYYEQNKIPGRRFIKNLLKFTGNKNVNDFIEECNKEGKKVRKDPSYSGNPDWDGTLNKDYVDKLMEKAGCISN